MNVLLGKLAGIPNYFRMWQPSAARDGANGVLRRRRLKFVCPYVDLEQVTSNALLKHPSGIPLTPGEMDGLGTAVHDHATQVCSNLDKVDSGFRSPWTGIA